MQLRFRSFVWRLLYTMSITAGAAEAGQWPEAYDVTAPYSGPTLFGGSKNFDWIRIKGSSGYPVIGSGTALPVTGQQLIDLAAPYPDQIPDDFYVPLWSKQAGEYYVGGSTMSAVYSPEGEQLPSIRAFVGKNGDIRTSITNPNFAPGDFLHTDYVINDLNSLGQVVVTPYGGSSSIYDYETDTKIDLTPLVAGPGSKVEAMGIDDTGAVVGSSGYVDGSGETIKHAFIYRDGVMTDLNDLVQLSDGKYLDYATDLTDTGEIIANMVDPTKPGWINWVKLTPTPVPEPASWLVAAGGIAFYAIVRRRSVSNDRD